LFEACSRQSDCASVKIKIVTVEYSLPNPPPKKIHAGNLTPAERVDVKIKKSFRQQLK